MAALWIDAFVIYSLTRLFIVLLSFSGSGISFEALFVLTGAMYEMVMLSRFRQTAGKMLLNITVTSETGETARPGDLLLGVVFGKWGVTFALPVILGQLLAGNSWLPTVSAILVMIPTAIFCMVYFSFTKQAWYEAMAGLTLMHDASLRTSKAGFFWLMAAAIPGIGATGTEYLVTGRVQCRMAAFQNLSSPKPFEKFLLTQHTSPVDYVVGLFDKYDVVVLCERSHPEMTQWDFIYDVVRDPRFIHKAGHVFTEYGQVGMQDTLDRFMMTDSLGKPEVKQHILQLMHNMAVWPAWTNYNFYRYLERLYSLNQTLPPAERVRHHFTDGTIKWPEIRTVKDYKAYEKKILWNRDSIMAGTVLEEMKKLSETSAKPAKCLVIMNYRHAMDLTDRLPGVRRRNTYEFIKDGFGSRAANVLINTRCLVTLPIAGGVWDAAFEKTGNKPVGFDFRGSPFGHTRFDLFPFDILFQLLNRNNSPSANGWLRYCDVFTGFVFTHPVREQYFQTFIPGYFDGFGEEYVRRSFCLGDDYGKAAGIEMQSLKTDGPGEINKQVDFKVESAVELSFYGIAGIGLLVGSAAFVFRRRKF